MNKEIKKSIWITIIFLVLCLSILGLVLHIFEATANIRCSGKYVFPISQDDVIFTGKIKLSNYVLFNLGLSNPRLYAPISNNLHETHYTGIGLGKECQAAINSDFIFR